MYSAVTCSVYPYFTSTPPPPQRKIEKALAVWYLRHGRKYCNVLYLTRIKEGGLVGCPRNKKNFFSVRTEINRNSFCFGCFSVSFAKPKNIFSVCFGLSDRYQNNRNKQNFLETNRTKPKKSPKNVLY
jgi:hypothetical protein